MNSTRKHYHLVTGQILYKNEEGEIGSMPLNAVITGDTSKIPLRALGKAQTGLQMNFHKRMEDPSLTVIDVVVLGLTYCGHMTEKEWNKAPEGTQLQEVATDDPFKLN